MTTHTQKKTDKGKTKNASRVTNRLFASGPIVAPGLFERSRSHVQALRATKHGGSPLHHGRRRGSTCSAEDQESRTKDNAQPLKRRKQRDGARGGRRSVKRCVVDVHSSSKGA